MDEIKRLEMAIVDLVVHFSGWFTAQRSYLKSLNDWLMKGVCSIPEETDDGIAPFSPRKLGAPSIFVVCNYWYESVDVISERNVLGAMKVFAHIVFKLWQQRSLEQQQSLIAIRDMDSKLRLMARDEQLMVKHKNKLMLISRPSLRPRLHLTKLACSPTSPASDALPVLKPRFDRLHNLQPHRPLPNVPISHSLCSRHHSQPRPWFQLPRLRRRWWPQDTVNTVVASGTLSIAEIFGSSSTSKLGRDQVWNCASISGSSSSKGDEEVGDGGGVGSFSFTSNENASFSLSLHKGLPFGSDLDSNAAFVVAALANTELFGGRLTSNELVLVGLESLKKVSGYHADDVGPSILGGFILIQSYDPFEIIQLEFSHDQDLFFMLVSPDFEASTKKMRETLPTSIPMKDHIWNSSQAVALVAVVVQGNVRVLRSAMAADAIVEPRRAPLIPGMVSVKKTTMEAGVFGCTISGSGLTIVAVINEEEKGNEILSKMMEAFTKERNLQSIETVAKLDRVGARVIGTEVA
ncbi:hypothetical protein ZIOFF_012557 [Zingiber officinale]|uniref:Homoserine kinase n=1 Tax=Zingiber officinale TaxID=94328 RepID=A0A8J5LQU1_ZINOF|nr:hypothetical protein ZIOFF_012557 [Zingiber officinale]